MTKLTVGQKFLSSKTGNINEVTAISGSGMVMIASTDDSRFSSTIDRMEKAIKSGYYTEVVEAKELNKKEFQKVIKNIRDSQPLLTGTYRNTGEAYSRKAEYPKAMLTSQQIKKRTATVNCGGSWKSSIESLSLASEILEDENFSRLMQKFNCRCSREEKTEGGKTYTQVRIRW